MICSPPPKGTLQLPCTHLPGVMLPWMLARQMYIGVPGLGSEPGPPMMAPFEASGVNGELTRCHRMLWPSMELFCACIAEGTIHRDSTTPVRRICVPDDP